MFNVEYKLATSKFCAQANSPSYNFNSILKNVNLYDVPYTPLPLRHGNRAGRGAPVRA